MPEIPQEALATGSKFLKPATMNLKVGARVHFTISAPHVESAGTGQQSGKTLRSLPVSYQEGKDRREGSFPLNKTNMSYIAKALGNNSDTWVGASFDAIVLPQNNPNTSQQVLSWTIEIDSIKAKA